MSKDLYEEILLENHKEYLRDKENLKYAKAGTEEIFERDEVERLYKRRDELSANRRKDPGITAAQRSGIRTIAERIKDTFIIDGQVNIIGAEIAGPQELASLLQIYKNPNFETYRLIYMKENKIVGIEGTTCRLPGVTVTHDPKLSPKEYIERVRTRMNELEADGFYMTHNHPSGDVTPSFEDEIATYRYATGIPGFIGHIITDHTIFSYQTKDECDTLEISDKYQLDVFERCVGNRNLLELTINKPHEIANISKMLNMNADTSLIIYIDSNRRISKVDELPNGFMNSELFKEYITDNIVGKGYFNAFCLTEQEDVLTDMTDYVVDKYLEDCILVDGRDYISARSFLVRSKTVDKAGKLYDSFPCYSFYDTESYIKEPNLAFYEAKESALYKHLAEVIAVNGSQETSNRSWITTYDDLSEIISYEDYINNLNKLESELNSRDEVIDVQIVGDEIDVIYNEKYCPNLIEEGFMQPIFNDKADVKMNVKKDDCSFNMKRSFKGINGPGGK